MHEPKCPICSEYMEPSGDIRRWFCRACAMARNEEEAEHIVSRLRAELVTANLAMYDLVDYFYHEALKPGLEGDRAYAGMQRIKDQIETILKGGRK